MANSAQARKRVRQAEKRRNRNKCDVSSLRTSIKKVEAQIIAGNKDEAVSALQAATPTIDKMARKGLIHTNKAARSKSRLNKTIQAMV